MSTRFIAIVIGEEVYEDYYDNFVCYQITDWTEVSEADYQLLCKASSKSFDYKSKLPKFRVIERPKDEIAFTKQTIESFLNEVEAENERINKERLNNEKLKQEKALKRKKAQLEKLKKELGE